MRAIQHADVLDHGEAGNILQLCQSDKDNGFAKRLGRARDFMSTERQAKGKAEGNSIGNQVTPRTSTRPMDEDLLDKAPPRYKVGDIVKVPIKNRWGIDCAATIERVNEASVDATVWNMDGPGADCLVTGIPLDVITPSVR